MTLALELDHQADFALAMGAPLVAGGNGAVAALRQAQEPGRTQRPEGERPLFYNWKGIYFF